MKVHWTNVALEQLTAIHDYIARDSQLYAQRVVDRITKKSMGIGTLPWAGSMVPEYESPELREVFDRPYRIIYRILQDQIDVVAVIHGARQLPPIS